MKNIILVASALLLVGCGGGGSKTYVTEVVEANTTEPMTIPEGDAIIVEGGGDIVVTDDSITIECGEGGCGDVYIGNEIDNSDNSNTDVNNTDIVDNSNTDVNNTDNSHSDVNSTEINK